AIAAEVYHAVVGGAKLDGLLAVPVEVVARAVAHAHDEGVAAGGKLEALVDARRAVAGDARRRHARLVDPPAVDLELDGDGRPLARAYLGPAHVGRQLGELLG